MGPSKIRHGQVFKIRDCALLAIATGNRAQNLRELRDHLQSIHPDSIYHHFWGGLMRPKFVDPEYSNDFAAWSRHGLHDSILAERLGVLDPTEFDDLESLRQELVEVVEARLDESEHVSWSKADQQFNFIRSQIVVFDTHKVIPAPEALAEYLPHLSVGSVFYHFVDARRRTPGGGDDFREWLAEFGEQYVRLRENLAALDYYFVTVAELKAELSELFRDYFAFQAPA